MEMKLLQMAEACEQASGLLAEEVAIKVIREAWKLLNPMPQVRVSRQANGEPRGGDGLGPYTPEYNAWEKRRIQIEAYLTAGASLDAAMSLVPEGCFYGFLMDGAGEGFIACCQFSGPDQEPPDLLWTKAATPALALTAAALKARSKSHD